MLAMPVSLVTDQVSVVSVHCWVQCLHLSAMSHYHGDGGLPPESVMDETRPNLEMKRGDCL